MKKAFTLIELLIVVIIVSLLLGAIGKMFSYKQVNTLKYDTCILHIKGKLDNFFQNAILQKGVYTGNSWKKVTAYIVEFDKNNQKINFIYSGTNVKNTIKLNGTGFDRINNCFAPGYYTKLSGENLKVVIKPGLQVDNKADGDAGIVLYTGSSFSNKANNGTTGSVSFYYCEGSSTSLKCFEEDKIVIDTKVNTIKTYFCKKKKQNPCTSWSE